MFGVSCKMSHVFCGVWIVHKTIIKLITCDMILSMIASISFVDCMYEKWKDFAKKSKIPPQYFLVQKN